MVTLVAPEDNVNGIRIRVSNKVVEKVIRTLTPTLGKMTIVIGVATRLVLARRDILIVHTRIRIGIKSNLCRVKPRLACAIASRIRSPVRACIVPNANSGDTGKWGVTMPVTMTSGKRRRSSSMKLGPHRPSMMRMRRKMKKRKPKMKEMTMRTMENERYHCIKPWSRFHACWVRVDGARSGWVMGKKGGGRSVEC